ncbi:MAG TPA: hypothetical protein PK677_11355 [Acidiphilium sp.]|nr:hypothetical protein [Acidiphilium sp.]
MAFKDYRPASGIPAKGAGSGAPPKLLDTSPEKQAERAKKSNFVQKQRAENRRRAVEEARAEFHEPEPSRQEIAALARRGMADAVVRIERLIHESRSDMAVVTAFNAFKETAYGKDPQAIDLAVEFENMTDDELRAAIATELGAAIAASGGNAGDAEAPQAAGEPD